MMGVKLKSLPFPRRPNYEERLKELEEKEKELELRERVRQKERDLGLRPSFKKPAWGKAMMAVIFAVCIEIVIYAEWVMYARYDLSALYALIGVPVAMFGTFWAYAEKSKKENTKGGITYDMAMLEAMNKGADSPEDDETEEDANEESEAVG